MSEIDIPPPSPTVKGVLMQYSEMNAEDSVEISKKSGSVSSTVKCKNAEHHEDQSESVEPSPAHSSEENTAEPEKSLSQYLYEALTGDHATEDKRAKVLEELLAKGANNSFLDSNQQTPFHWACALGDLETAQALFHRYRPTIVPLLQESKTCSPLHRACMTSQRKVIEWLLTLEGINLNLQDEEGFTALHWTCEKDIDIARKLLSEGASPSVQDADGNTPIHVAICYGHDAFAREMGCLEEDSMLIENNEGTTPEELLRGAVFCSVPSTPKCQIQ